jgi:hypothetical protein
LITLGIRKKSTLAGLPGCPSFLAVSRGHAYTTQNGSMTYYIPYTTHFADFPSWQAGMRSKFTVIIY